jgi:SPP1 gp7 family putative phage head morphogenesis protein
MNPSQRFSEEKAKALAAVLDRFLEAVPKARKATATAKLRRAFRRFFKAQGRLVLAGIEKLPRRRQLTPVAAAWRSGVCTVGLGRTRLREADDPPELPDLELMLEELIKAGAATSAIVDDVLQGMLEQAMEAGADAAIQGAGVSLSFDLGSDAAVEYIKKNAAELVSGINETSRVALRDLIAADVKAGKTYTTLADDIRTMFNDWSDSRSKTIAVTEMGNAFEEGGLLAAQSLEAAGLQMQKSWLTAGDDKVESVCEDNAADGWISLGEDFSSGDPRPLAHPNCRCTMLTRRNPEKADAVQ